MSSDAKDDLSLLYRAGAREEPPQWLDDKIRAAAASHVRAQTWPLKLRRILVGCRLPLALAAVVVLSVSLTLIMRDEFEPRQEAAAPRPKAVRVPDDTPDRGAANLEPASTVEAPAPEPVRSTAPARSGPVPGARESSAQAPPGGADGQSSQEATVPGVPGKAATVMSYGEKRAVAGSESGPSSGSPPRPLPQPMSGAQPDLGRPAEAPRLQLPANIAERERSELTTRRASAVEAQDAGAEREAPEDDPSAWLRFIEQLQRDGRDRQVREHLKRFKERYPSYPLPHALK